MHRSCLERWQRTILLRPHELHSSGSAESRHVTCSVCSSTLSVAPPSRHSLLSELVGEKMTNRLVAGELLVASPAMSSRKAHLRLPFPLAALFELKLAHWRRAVYLITEVADVAEDDADAPPAAPVVRIHGVNVSRPIVEAERLPREVADAVAASVDGGGEGLYEIAHHNGGPVEWGSCVTALLALVPPDTPVPDGVRVLHGGLAHGPLAAVLELAQAQAAALATGQPVRVRTFSGFAQWTSTQLLGEVARGDWGVASSDELGGAADGRLWDEVIQQADCVEFSDTNELSTEFQEIFADSDAAAEEEDGDDEDGDAGAEDGRSYIPLRMIPAGTRQSWGLDASADAPGLLVIEDRPRDGDAGSDDGSDDGGGGMAVVWHPGGPDVSERRPHSEQGRAPPPLDDLLAR